ncbi:MAG: carboxymuconolactone decarboxylase family protein [Burkholderiales bacterium]|nr:carboxymuconolactone decarboxylase family protein [Burkholderiales bacterium]
MLDILGERYVEQRDRSSNDFNRPLRDISVEFGFGAIWARPGLERKFRNLLCLAMLTALNRPEEIRIHVGLALNHGASVEEVREALLQTVWYCGYPAAAQSFKLAEEVLRERGLL